MRDPDDRVTLQLAIAGGVQGVGYRDAMCRAANRLGVRGWVRNRRDGSVEAVVQGERAAVDALIAWARRGPPAARVAHVAARAPAAEFDRPYAGFDWLPSA
jgi:acylphosphatase